MEFEEFLKDEIEKVGSELASARKLLNKESVDFILDLRTTKHHINAIETGELRIFYGPPFYLDLLRRYASILNFSDQQIYEFELRVKGEYEEYSEKKEAKKSDQQSIQKGDQESVVHTKKRSNKILRKKEDSFPTYTALRMTETEKKVYFERNKIILRYISSSLLVLIIAVYFLNYRIEPPKAAQKTVAVGLKPVITNSIDIENHQVDIDTIKLRSKPVQENTGEMTIKRDKSFLDDETKSAEENLRLFNETDAFVVLEEFNPEITNDLQNSPQIIFDVRKRTWLWIKFADESINEFVVQPNEKVLLEKYPIYVVVGDPDNVFLWIKGEKYQLEPNDPDRNITRLTRSQLLNLKN